MNIDDAHDYDYYYMDAMGQFKNTLTSSGFYNVGRGSTRRAFLRGKIVIKLPLGLDGLVDNGMEWLAWRKYRHNPTPLGLILAPCRLMRNGCLMMPFVDQVNTEDQVPWNCVLDNEWIVDGVQVGRYKDRVVAYDYAFDLPERIEWENQLDLISRWQEDWYPWHRVRYEKAIKTRMLNLKGNDK